MQYPTSLSPRDSTLFISHGINPLGAKIANVLNHSTHIVTLPAVLPIQTKLFTFGYSFLALTISSAHPSWSSKNHLNGCLAQL